MIEVKLPYKLLEKIIDDNKNAQSGFLIDLKKKTIFNPKLHPVKQLPKSVVAVTVQRDQLVRLKAACRKQDITVIAHEGAAGQILKIECRWPGNTETIVTFWGK